MSRRPISRSEDLARLRDEGYTLRIVRGRLVVDDVPYVDIEGNVRHDGRLVMNLTLAGETTTTPDDHTAYFVGGIPCDMHGVPLEKIINNKNATDLGNGLVAACYFSAKVTEDGVHRNYHDYHEKVTVYVGRISGPATALDAVATARRHRPVAPEVGDDGPFKYIDTASSRAGIDALNRKLAEEKVGIIGLGGSGEYILDYVSKTEVPEIDLFDGDPLLTHNAFRAPGAASLEQLDARPLKVDHFAEVYGNMRHGVVGHPYRIDADNVAELQEMTFVFVAIDDAAAKEPIISALRKFGTPFIDVGMGVEMIDGRLTGILRTTTGTPEKDDHVEDRISFAEATTDDDYRSNIQIAELNAMNAALAVIQWKRHRKIYADIGTEHHSTFSIATNHIVNAEPLVNDDDDGGTLQ